MMLKYFILTNNPYVREQYDGLKEVMFVETSYKGIIERAKELILDGYKMLTHPLSGSVKPNETPYKSIMFKKEKGELDVNSLDIINKAEIAVNKFSTLKEKWKEDAIKDFQAIDFTLIDSAMGSIL